MAFVEAIRIAVKPQDLRGYTYHSLGGPTLEDFRLIYEFYPELRMVCIEENHDVHKRQQFHRPCRFHRLKLEHASLRSYIAQFEASDRRSIFWLDYTNLSLGHFEDFMSLLGKVGADSIVKITLSCDPRNHNKPEKIEEFKKTFETLLPNPLEPPPNRPDQLASLLQEMLQIASQRVLPSAMPLMFLPLSSFYYNDGAGIFTLTGAVCMRTHEPNLRKAFRHWRFRNLDWNQPREINVPNLSTRERMHLQRHLPCEGKNAGKVLGRALGHLIDRSREQTEIQLQQYAAFHRYFPYFVRATP